ncbi:MAG TPA: peptide chain release factor N(5)-glutamine methyltransferase [Terriglobales bacterium]|nr:peptide chain release factor N(5)-glutamine methyltransferase [Terriglobales bacterium]
MRIFGKLRSTMLLKEALFSALEYLESNSVGSPRLNAEVLLMFTLEVDRAYLYAHPERDLSEDEVARYREALDQRARGVPSQYITGHQEFWGLDFLVSPAVLIPRPETEHVVEAVLRLVRDSGAGGRPRIVDVGTGSGAIALALAHELPQAEVHAVDLSGEALEVARANAARLQLTDRVRFTCSDLLTAFDERPQFDFVVSNPPYVGEGEEDRVQREVKKFEPRMAVFAGLDGLDTIRRLIPQANARLIDGGWLLMEIGYTQSAAVQELLKDWRDVHAIPDLQGIPRVIAAKK